MSIKFKARVEGYAGDKQYVNAEEFVKTLTNFLKDAQPNTEIKFTLFDIKKDVESTKPVVVRTVVPGRSKQFNQYKLKILEHIPIGRWKNAGKLRKEVRLPKRTFTRYLSWLRDSKAVDAKFEKNMWWYKLD